MRTKWKWLRVDGLLQNKANEGSYKETDRRLKEQFINGINDDDMMTEKIRELITNKMRNEIISEHMSSWARRVDVQRVYKGIQCHKKHKLKMPETAKEIHINCKYHGSRHEPGRCPAYGESCSSSRCVNHFEHMQKPEQTGVKRCQ